MTNNFSPSVNIEMDADKGFLYLPTDNARHAFDRMFAHDGKGARSFCLIGSYGTGKSSFVLAAMDCLKGQNEHFGTFEPNRFDFLSVQGHYASLIEAFKEHLSIGAGGPKEVLAALKRRALDLRAQNKGLIIIIDEFGKFLEFAAANEPEKELFFVQQLAELANDDAADLTFISTLHQEFDAYSAGNKKKLSDEWEKVKGRLIEIPFNEPVEQLLVLAASYIQKSGKKTKAPKLADIIKIVEKARIFPLKNNISKEGFAESLAPLDMVAASVLAQCLQKYGQNERSLFTFLQSDQNKGLQRYDTSNPYYNLACVYDYLNYNFYNFLYTNKNPDYIQWSAMQKTVERVEYMEGDALGALKIVKTIGLLNLFAAGSAKIDEDFLYGYAEHCLGLNFSEQSIDDLKKFHIIKFVNNKNRFVLTYGSNLNIDIALKEAEKDANYPKNIAPDLKKHLKAHYVLAKEAQYEIGTPRVFEVKINENAATERPRGELDGIVQLVFTDSCEDVRKISAASKEAVLYGVCKSTEKFRAILYEINKVLYVRSRNTEDFVAIKELDALILTLEKKLDDLLKNSLYDGGFDWIFLGQSVKINSVRAFNQKFSEICRTVYCDTPVFKSELINKHSISSGVTGARGAFFQALLDHHRSEGLGFDKNVFPPEKSIYKSLLENTGIHRPENGALDLYPPLPGTAFYALWENCERFLKTTATKRRTLSDFTEYLAEPPLKLKDGFVTYWLPVFLFMKRHDFALFHEGRFVPDFNAETIDLIYRTAQKFEIKAFDLEGIRLEVFNTYRLLVAQNHVEHPDKNSFVETIKPFLVFHRQLGTYAKSTKTGVSIEAARFRETIEKAKDPEKFFFEDLPAALGFAALTEQNSADIEAFTERSQNVLAELREAYNHLLDRFEAALSQALGIETENGNFLVCKKALQKRYEKLEKHRALKKQITLLNQIFSPLDERPAWLDAIAKALLDKKLDAISDTEEALIPFKIRNMIAELDNLLEISQIKVDENTNAVFKIDITTFEGTVPYNVVFPKDKIDHKLLQKIGKQLGEDRDANIVILTKLLEEQIGKRKG